MRKLMVGLIAVSVFCLCGHSFALQILYPADGTFVSKSNYLVIMGGSDPLLDGMSIAINGVKSDVIDLTGQAYREAFGDKLVVEPVFDPGENLIIVEGFLGKEKMSEVRANVYYLSRNDESPPEGYQRERFHLEEREAPCARCHNMSPSEEMLQSPDPRKNPCASCHIRMLDKAYVHGPAGVFECTYCHQTDSRPFKYEPRGDDADLCLECHEDMRDEFRQSKFTHGPIEAGLCLVCHDAHASDQASQVTMPVSTLCLECHEKVATDVHVVRIRQGGHPISGGVDPVRPKRPFSCASCHAPHAADTKTLLGYGAKSRLELCVQCHAK